MKHLAFDRDILAACRRSIVNGKGQMTVNYSITGHRLGEGCAALKPHVRVHVAS